MYETERLRVGAMMATAAKHIGTRREENINFETLIKLQHDDVDDDVEKWKHFLHPSPGMIP